MISEITNHFQKERYFINSPIKSNDFSDSNLNSSSDFVSFIVALFPILYLVAENIVTAMVANEIITEMDEMRKDSAAPYFDEFALDWFGSTYTTSFCSKK